MEFFPITRTDSEKLAHFIGPGQFFKNNSDRSGDRDGQDCPQDTTQFKTDQHRQNNGQRI